MSARAESGAYIYAQRPRVGVRINLQIVDIVNVMTQADVLAGMSHDELATIYAAVDAELLRRTP